MNRFVDGIGLTPIPEQYAMEGKLIKEGSYIGMLDPPPASGSDVLSVVAVFEVGFQAGE